VQHDFKLFPELTNSQMATEYHNSPHKQILENFEAIVYKVHDGDTVTLRWKQRDFDFTMRMVAIDAPELNMKGGHEARDYLKGEIEGKLVQILIDPKNRVEKYGRLLGDIMFRGIVISEDLLQRDLVWTFESRKEELLPDMKKELNIKQWLKT